MSVTEFGGLTTQGGLVCIEFSFGGSNKFLNFLSDDDLGKSDSSSSGSMDSFQVGLTFYTCYIICLTTIKPLFLTEAVSLLPFYQTFGLN